MTGHSIKDCPDKKKYDLTPEDSDLINGLKHMANDHECCRETVYCAIHEIEHLGRKSNCVQFDLDAWEAWAREVCDDFKIEYDNHPIGLRLAIVKWMAGKNKTK